METSDGCQSDAQRARAEYIATFKGREARELAGLAFDQLIEDAGAASREDLDYLKEEILGCTDQVREKINKADPEAGVTNSVQDERPGESLMPFPELDRPAKENPGVPMDFFKMWDTLDTASLDQ